ncbi:MAG: Na+/H+ antiporter NhaC family protein [Flammeovirgaceae bacterium]
MQNIALRKPALWEALLPIFFLVSALAFNVFVFKDDGLSGSNQMILIFSAGIAALMAFRLGMTWEQVQESMVRSIGSAMAAILILLMIGALAGTWMLSGIVPAMIYYGLKIMNPTIFLVASCIVCCVVSLATGSSWSTVATIGIALLGIGKTLGINEGLIAGAIISGAYFGDKVSPLSDTTNLAPAVAGTDLFTHIRYVMITTVPTLTITLIIFFVIGFFQDNVTSKEQINSVLGAIDTTFNLNPLLFLVPASVIFMIVKKMPALPAILIGALLGGVFAIIFQKDVVLKVVGEGMDASTAMYVGVMKAMYGKISVVTSNEVVNELLTTKGMAGMLNTIWLIICAMMFGGIMEASGMLNRITEPIIQKAQSSGSLIASTACTCVFFNLTASDQYLAIVVPGRMYAKAFVKRGLSPENLSRTLEDSGTVTSVLVPWNTCGATQTSVLGVATLTYLPYCFFNILSPLMTILVGYLQIKIKKLTKEEVAKMEVD